VERVDAEIRRLVDDLFDTMYAAPGVGLAATQVDVHQRVLVADVSEDRSNPLCFINPEIRSRAGSQTCEEGCLSVPGYYESVVRSERIRVAALNRDGEAFEMDADGLLAVCTRSTIWKASSSLITCRSSSASAFASVWRRRTGPAGASSPRSAGPPR
jgi:peptide deformylase